MKATFTLYGKNYNTDLEHPIDISIPITAGDDAVNAFNAPLVKIEPVRTDNFIGSVKEGGPCDFMNISFNPHGNGTHTECIGHISRENISINDTLKDFFFLALLVSIEPRINEFGDNLIFRDQLEEKISGTLASALVIRTLPNSADKLSRKYSNTNPPFFDHEVMAVIKEAKIDHLIIDLPSVDREEDGGSLLSHHAFWDYDPENFSPESNHRLHSTITELIYVPDEIKDGLYILNLQIASFNNDASPSKPVLYTID